MGHEVVVATDGAQALPIYDQLQCPIVISDVMMPILSGLELCRHIRAKTTESYTYIILLTAVEGRNIYYEGIEAGADDLLAKPFNGDEVRARLHVAERIIALKDQVSKFERILSICAWCKKISDNDVWIPLENYVARHEQASLSHGLCATCFERETGWAGQAPA